MKLKELKTRKEIYQLMKGELCYAGYMKICIFAMVLAWAFICLLLLVFSKDVEIICIIAFAIMIMTVLYGSRYIHGYDTNLTAKDADDFEKDLEEECLYAVQGGPVAVTKKHVYIIYRSKVYRLDTEKVINITVNTDYTKRRMGPSVTLQFHTWQHVHSVHIINREHPMQDAKNILKAMGHAADERKREALGHIPYELMPEQIRAEKTR